ncbi:DUF736 family protein [Eilatimonas milleporae]|uniref:Uncharacterized protein (DUF736 family) n=1 Tax=Eilatimonas milleporae TaxID=911205 RepID=A0A3M0CHB9_9PROT|nr:DUF736 family protein [Eilatimonas milleporae]RMB09034.1 uncharacterized protein (DUF736 family) [Eilatimonas milleporae]
MASEVGYVEQTGEKNFRGVLKLLTYQGEIEFVPCISERENAPEMLVYSRGVEIGSASRRIGKSSGKEHVSIALKHPQITNGRPVLFANLGKKPDQDDDRVFSIIMN